MKKQISSRRKFITDSVMTGTGLAVGMSVFSSVAKASETTTVSAGRTFDFFTGFAQQPLPYAYNALEKSIDAMTMEIHYSKHAAAYASNLQDEAKAKGVDMTKPLEDVLMSISKYSTKMRNNGGGHYNHELFWKAMAADGGGTPSGKLMTSIQQSFNSFDAFKTQFGDAGKGRFGSGWAWLFLDSDKKLRIGSTPNQDNPLMDISDIKGFPVLGLDVWEHAYYLRYQNKRADYINAWWNVVNWKYVQERFEKMA